MKNANILIVMLTIVLGSISAKGQESFCSVSHSAVHNHNVITFSVPREANVYQYRVLAGSDSTNMQLIGTIKPKGNKVTAQDYTYDVYDPQHTYYQIVLIGMDSRMRYSSVVCTKQDIRVIPKTDTQNSSYLGCPVAQAQQ